MVLIGEEIPERLSIIQRGIFYRSDSLYLNGQLLRRNDDYTYDSGQRRFDLSRLEFSSNDTLQVTYHPIPDWLQLSYGRSLPAVAPRTVNRSVPPFHFKEKAASPGSSDITISGAKSFQFSARSAGASNFSQSLDLQIQGSLAPGVEIIGAVSDRGYNPSYGPSNSRLSEIDRINLKLKSEKVTAQIGDIAVVSRFDTSPFQNKSVSGANISVQTRSSYVEALAARPRGRFESYRFFGVDGLQGPYQIGEGNAVKPVVPGSEQVWLDGWPLERGADKDYTIDYPTGQLTFSVHHPIDSRSRIEIDYEPRATDYRGELFSTGGGAILLDSALRFEIEFLREGDDKDQPLGGELSEEERDLLASVGDSVAAAVRSGVTLDSNGNYVLITDSLPDSIYQYMEESGGDYTVSFSYVGSGNGDYRFLGGSHYQFVGFGKGDYQPVIIVPAPERTDYYNARVGLRSKFIGDLTIEFRQTLSDRNLLSSRDDDDNRGSFYSLVSRKGWLWNGQRNNLTLKGRRKEATFRARNRLYATDFNRDYLLPDDFDSLTDETLYELALSVSPSSVIMFSPLLSRLEYQGSFESLVGGFKAQFKPHRRIKASFGWRTITAASKTMPTEQEGNASIYSGNISYRLSSRFQLSSNYEHDRRENNYRGERRGTKYDRYLCEFGGESEKLSYEYYIEDSLTVAWREILSRHRVSASSNRTSGNLTGNVRLSYQWLSQAEARDESFLGRLHLQYHDVRKRLNVSASYTLSEETRNARGITYIEVEQGQGNYVLEDGQYVPDPDGNYIRVEEILSDRSRVSRGEKSFHLSRDFKTVLVRFNSSIREELLDDGERRFWWVVPFLSDDTQPYLFYSRRYNADIRLFPLRSGHTINVTFSDDKEIRNIVGARKVKSGATVELTLKQVVQSTYIEESLELFKSNRDSYFSGGGETDGYKIAVTLRQLVSPHEFSTGGAYRRAESVRDEKSEIFSVHVGARLRVVKRGELRTSCELYRQVLANTTTVPSFQLTGNKPGKRGAVWSASLRYGLKGGLRINLSLSGRHSDDRIARITGRGDMVVGF